jgi:hypothetical protein
MHFKLVQFTMNTFGLALPQIVLTERGLWPKSGTLLMRLEVPYRGNYRG